MGLGAQLIRWPDGFCDALLAKGLHLIRFDNRDVGQSTHMTNAPMPNFMAAMAGDYSSVSYRLTDMAADAIGILDKLGIESVHLVGASMGGFIAQTIAIEHPRRVRSLTSIMSSTGDTRVGQIHPEAMQIFGGASPGTREEVIERGLFAARIVGSPAFPAEPEVLAERIGREYDRGYDGLGVVRQGVAVVASGDRTPGLRKIDTPTLVIHGSADKVCDVSGGRATAAAVPGAELVVIEGMGHDLPRQIWPQLATKIAENVQRGEARRST
jgi:pimeloyl-ACP methyl ester carboxylesterase